MCAEGCYYRRAVLSHPVYVAAVLCLAIAASEWLVRHTWLRHFGTALLVIVATAVLANLDVIPTASNAPPLYTGVFRYLAPAGIFLLLLEVNLGQLRRSRLSMLLTFTVGSAATLAGIFLGLAATDAAAHLPMYPAVGGMFAGTYTGGAINFNAVFAIPAFVPFLGSPTFFADVNDHDFVFAFNVPGENEQKTNEFSIKADWEATAFDVTAIAAYNDLDEYLLSDGTSATFYGYELTDQCQADRATLNSFTRPDLFGEALAPFLVLPPGGGAVPPDFSGVYGPYTPTSCDGFQYQERNQKDSSFELRLTSKDDQKFRWIAGSYYLKIDREVVVAYGADQGQGFLRQPYVPPTGPNPTDLLFWDEFDTDVWAVFGQLEFDVSDNMEIALALRYDHEKRKVDNQVPNVMSSGLNGNLADQPINPAFNEFPDGIPDRNATFSEWQPKLTWRWSATDNMNVYASWGRGFRSGGFNSIGSEATIDFWYNTGFGGPGEVVDSQLTIRDEYDKEVADSFEIGFKSTLLGNRLRINAAAFYTEIDDYQFFNFFAGGFGIL